MSTPGSSSYFNFYTLGVGPDILRLLYTVVPGDQIFFQFRVFGHTVGEIPDLPGGYLSFVNANDGEEVFADGGALTINRTSQDEPPFTHYSQKEGSLFFSQPFAATADIPYTHLFVDSGDGDPANDPFVPWNGPGSLQAYLYVRPPQAGEDPGDLPGNNPDTIQFNITRTNPALLSPPLPGQLTEAQRQQFRDDADAIDRIVQALRAGDAASSPINVSSYTAAAGATATAASGSVGTANAAAQAALGVLAQALNHTPEVNPIQVTVQTATAIAGPFSSILRTLAADPPDGNYDTVQHTPDFGFPGIPDASVAANALIAAELDMLRAAIDALKSAERFQGAATAGDDASLALQEDAFEAALERYGQAKQAFSAAFASFLPELNLPDVELAADTSLADAQAYYAGLANPIADDPYLAGWSAQIVATYPGLDLVMDEIVAAVLADLAAQQPGGATGSSQAALTGGLASFSGAFPGTVGDDGPNLLMGGPGDEQLFGQGGNDTLIGGPGQDQLFGGDGIDTASWAGTTDGVTVDLRGGVALIGGALADSLNGVENLIGGSCDDLLIGDDGPNRIDGGGDQDEMQGMGGDDVLVGGTAPAGLVNQLFGGEGVDTVDYHLQAADLYVDLRGGVAFAAGQLKDTLNSAENVTGGTGADLLVGDDGPNVLAGGAGSDVLFGMGGDDVLAGGSAAAGGYNQLWGGDGSDTASYEDAMAPVQADLAGFGAYLDFGGALTLVDSYSSIENLVGSAFRDVLAGDAGATRIEGGLGGDVLYGRSGPDSFVYRSAADSNLATGYDVIADFETGHDILDLSAFGFSPVEGFGRTLIASDAGTTSVYVDIDQGAPGYELAINFIGPNAIAQGDIGWGGAIII